MITQNSGLPKLTKLVGCEQEKVSMTPESLILWALEEARAVAASSGPDGSLRNIKGPANVGSQMVGLVAIAELGARVDRSSHAGSAVISPVAEEVLAALKQIDYPDLLEKYAFEGSCPDWTDAPPPQWVPCDWNEVEAGDKISGFDKKPLKITGVSRNAKQGRWIGAYITNSVTRRPSFTPCFCLDYDRDLVKQDRFVYQSWAISFNKFNKIIKSNELILNRFIYVEREVLINPWN